VVGVEVGFGDGLMAPAALLHDVEAEVGEIGAPDGVRGVAIVAHRQLLRGVGHLRGVNAGDERLVDAVMAPPAGDRHVAGVDAGKQVARGELAVRGVAVGAIGRHRQPALQQPLAVNALIIIFHDIGLGAFITERRPLSRAVAIAAQGGKVARKGRRVGIVPAEDSVFAVTVRAGGRIRAALGQQLAMNALLEVLNGVGVANRAIDLGGYSGAGPPQGRVAAQMALPAGYPRVPRTGKFLLVHEHGAPAAGGFQLWVAMAALAVLIRHPLGIVDTPNLVGLVAVHAGRDEARMFLPQLAANDFAVYGLNQRMALCAGMGDVLLGDRRTGIGVRQNEMRRVATGANRGDDETTLEQAFAVDAFGIVLQDLVLRNVVTERDGRAFVVTAAT